VTTFLKVTGAGHRASWRQASPSLVRLEICLNKAEYLEDV